MESKYPVLMSEVELSELIIELDTLRMAARDLAYIRENSHDEVKYIFDSANGRPFGILPESLANILSVWTENVKECLAEQTCQECKRLVCVGRGENYQFVESLGHDVCNECFEKRGEKSGT